MKLEIASVSAPLRTPFVSASGSVEVRELLLLRLEDDAGGVGYGEAAPLAHYDGVGPEDCRVAIEDCRTVLAEADGSEREQLLRECSNRAVLPQAIAAHRVQAHLFDGYWEDIGTVGAFHKANIDLTRENPPFDFTYDHCPIYTRPRYLPCSRLSGARAQSVPSPWSVIASSARRSPRSDSTTCSSPKPRSTPAL